MVVVEEVNLDFVGDRFVRKQFAVALVALVALVVVVVVVVVVVEVDLDEIELDLVEVSVDGILDVAKTMVVLVTID